MEQDTSRRESLAIDHPRVSRVDRAIFSRTFAPDCMTHACHCTGEGLLLDACCRYGADVDVRERAAIVARAAEISAVLNEPVRDPARWFDESDPEIDADADGGVYVRTGRVHAEREDGRCVFLEHDARGCALHRVALEHGFDPAEIKPRPCRLYPLSYGQSELGLSDEVADYSCADLPGGPTIYRVMRGTLLEVFGKDLVRLLDRVEHAECGTRSRSLPVVA
ncbi:MAG: DUF3109 family protein [Myxococcales bacterium]|nr:DUF3109 family protein [Myxococcales bacterium]